MKHLLGSIVLEVGGKGGGGGGGKVAGSIPSLLLILYVLKLWGSTDGKIGAEPGAVKRGIPIQTEWSF